MENEKAVDVSETDIEDTRSKEQKEKDNFEADKMAELREKVWKFFNEEILTSDVPMSFIEAHLVQYLQGAIMITRGKSKLWEEANTIQKKYYETPINKLEFNEYVSEDKE